MIKLFCFIVGKACHCGFGVKIDSNNTVRQLKEAIKKECMMNFQPDQLKLFLAKKDGEWINGDDVAAVSLDIHGHPPGFEPIESSQLLQSDKLFGGADFQRSRRRFHVLVVLPFGITIKIGENPGNSELKLYRERGEMIQNNCKDYCKGILDKIETLYERSGSDPIPFLCVEGSSGMGKTQVAFALGGNRPWFYWPVTSTGSTSHSQLLNDNFASLSSAFDKVTRMDDPMSKADYEILGACSFIYSNNELWAYGFIRALLQYCCSVDTRAGVMLRVEEELPMHINKCNLKTVTALRDRMKADGKLLPFFVLDEMTVGEETGGERLAAFQRNIFRACGLVVVVMGKDPKMTNLTFRFPGTRCSSVYFLTIFTRFPPFQSISFTDEEKQNIWDKTQNLYPVLKSIHQNSRGRFARVFKESVVEYVKTNPGFSQCDLLDEAFLQVQLKTHSDANFTKDPYAQMMAISYENADPNCDDEVVISDPFAKRREIGVDSSCMETHFANLLIKQQTDIELASGLWVPGYSGWLLWCRFPTIDEDLLLYLSMLGGKTYPAYYDGNTTHSVFQVFSTYVQQLRHSGERSRNSVEIQNLYGDMVAHMIFCASRRNGVRGIRFEGFFPCLLAEFQEGTMRKAMAVGEDVMTIRGLLEGYSDLSDLLDVTIPFLAPPNAQWPEFLEETRENGCNVGHLVCETRSKYDHFKRSLYVYGQSVSVAPLLLCECMYWKGKTVDMNMMNEMLKRLDSTRKEWKAVLFFCVKFVKPLESPWERTDVGCVKINCQAQGSPNCQVEWGFQPDEGARKKLVIVLETGNLR